MNSTILSAKAALRTTGLVACLSIWSLSLLSAETQPTQGASDLKIELLARKVVRDRQGKETLQPADRAFPGEIVHYEAIYRNQSDQPLRQVEPTLPIPRGMVYLPNSANPPPVLASLDGRTFEPIPIRRKVTRPEGAYSTADITTGALPGKSIRYRITVTNQGSAPATQVKVFDHTPAYTLYTTNNPAATTVGSVTSTPAHNAAGPLEFDIGTLAPGQSAIITFGVVIRQ